MSGINPKTEFFARLEASLAENSFVRLSLSTTAAASTPVRKASVRLIALHGAPQLSFTYSSGANEETRNFPLPQGLQELQALLGASFSNAWLCTTQRDWQLHLPATGKPRLILHKPAHKTPPPRTHDLPHAGFLDASARDWLQGLEILDQDGRLRARMADKHRQVARYLEIFSHLAKDCGWATPGPRVVPNAQQTQTSEAPPISPPPSSAPPNELRVADNAPSELIIADMGCGKGYLTFGLWHLFQRVWQRPARILGAELRPELCDVSNQLARRLGATGLAFKPGSIASLDLPRLDGLIALHACNTATDEAILRGIELGAKLIIVAPCCHQELRPQLGRPEPFAAILRHGLMAERLAEWTTDGLRSLFLEWAGYHVKIIEFIASEHTPKNLMIAAVKFAPAFAAEPLRQRILDLKSFFGLAHHALDSLLERR